MNVLSSSISEHRQLPSSNVDDNVLLYLFNLVKTNMIFHLSLENQRNFKSVDVGKI